MAPSAEPKPIPDLRCSKENASSGACKPSTCSDTWPSPPLTWTGTLGICSTIERLISLCHDWPHACDARRLPSAGRRPPCDTPGISSDSRATCRPLTGTALWFRRHKLAGGRSQLSPAREVALARPDRDPAPRHRHANRSPGFSVLIERPLRRVTQKILMPEIVGQCLGRTRRVTSIPDREGSTTGGHGELHQQRRRCTRRRRPDRPARFRAAPGRERRCVPPRCSARGRR